MLRTSLSLVFVLTACGPAMGGDEADMSSLDAEGEISLTASSTLSAASRAIDLAVELAPNPKTLVPTRVDACTNYDSITAALGSLTIACTGTVGPHSYAVDDSGYMVPRFDKCDQKPIDDKQDVYGDILSLLSLQKRLETLPEILRCVGGAFANFQKKAAAAGITGESCPYWQWERTIGAPDERSIAKIAKTLPQLPTDPKDPPRPPPIPHENYEMTVAYKDGKPSGRCKTALDCAQQCSSGFRGLWVQSTEKTAIIDPSYWLVTANFPESSNPFLRAGYYHPMSFSGTVPGAMYGHRNRKFEACSRWVVDAHVLLNLQPDCLDDSDPMTCVTVCSEPIPETNGTQTQNRY